MASCHSFTCLFFANSSALSSVLLRLDGVSNNASPRDHVDMLAVTIMTTEDLGMSDHFILSLYHTWLFL